MMTIGRETHNYATTNERNNMLKKTQEFCDASKRLAEAAADVIRLNDTCRELFLQQPTELSPETQELLADSIKNIDYTIDVLT